MNEKGRGRTRNFATVVYPESAPPDWLDILIEQKIPAFISPLHNADVNPTGEIKKEHYHVLIMFEGVKTVEQATKIFELIGGVGCEVVQSLRGYARYLCHMDNPEKHQYSVDDVRSLCGADYYSTVSLVIDRHKELKKMIAFIKENKIYMFSDFYEYCAEEQPEWFRLISDNCAYVIKEYQKSLMVKARMEAVDELQKTNLQITY